MSLLAIIGENFVLQHAASGNPREHPPAPGFDDLAQPSIVTFDSVGRVNQPANLGWIGKEGGQVFPVILPRLDRNGILLAPRLAELQEVTLGLFAGTGLIDRFQIGHKVFALFPDRILQAVADLMNDAALNLGLGKDGMDGLFEAG